MPAAAPPAAPPSAARPSVGGGDDAPRTADATPPAKADPVAELRAENEVLRAVAATSGCVRLVRELHRIGMAAAGPAATALLEKPPGGASWAVRASAGREMSSAVLRALPDPLKPPTRPEPLDTNVPSLDGAWAVPVSGGGRSGLWVAPPPPTGGDLGRGRRFWETVGDAVWHRFVTGEALAAARGVITLRDAQVALYAAAAEPGEPQAVLGRLLTALIGPCGADRVLLYTAGADGRRIASAGADLPRPVAEVAAEQHCILSAAVSAAAKSGAAADVAQFDRQALADLGVKSLVGRAAGATVGGGAASAVLLTLRADAGPFPPHSEKVLAWAAGFFADALPRCSRAAVASRRASKDGLTGLANRRTFDERMAGLFAAAQATGGDLALVMCDLDHFKSVNDTHGHAVGDRVLREAADAIREALSACRSDDSAVAARYGGEELVVLLPNFGAAGAQRVGEGIRKAVSQISLPAGGQRTHATTSVGIALYPFDAEDAAGLLEAADAALYKAKTGGRDRVVRASPAGRTAAAAVPSAPR